MPGSVYQSGTVGLRGVVVRMNDGWIVYGSRGKSDGTARGGYKKYRRTRDNGTVQRNWKSHAGVENRGFDVRARGMEKRLLPPLVFFVRFQRRLEEVGWNSFVDGPFPRHACRISKISP